MFNKQTVGTRCSIFFDIIVTYILGNIKILIKLII